VLIAVLVFLILRQVMPIAAGLAGGLALSSFGLLSRTATMGMRMRVRSASPAAERFSRYISPRFAETKNYVGEKTGAGTNARNQGSGDQRQ
jgi:type IV secretion system protein VirB6